MKLQCPANNWSCMPFALAMALDVPVEDIIRLVGHDGSHHPWPVPFQFVRAGFHIHEIIDVAFLYYRRLLCPFVREPTVTCDERCPEIPAKFVGTDTDARWRWALRNNTGIMTGQMMDTGVGHAVAWDGQKIYDPRGYVYSYDDRHHYLYEPDTFWLLGGYDGNPSKILS